MNPSRKSKGEALADFLEDRGVRFNRTRTGWQKARCYGAGHAHGDRDPSMSINLGTGYVRCWSCELTDGRAVDAIHLIQEEQSLTYGQALTTLGIDSTTQDSGETETWL